jgi:chromosome segregation ATPase
MPAWLLTLIVTTIISSVVAGFLKVWGREIARFLKTLLAAVTWNTNMDRNMKSEEEYRLTTSATMEALKEKIGLLEKWRGEARDLELRVDELEKRVRILRRESLAKEDEIIKATEELIQAKRALSQKELDITNLKASLNAERDNVTELKALVADNHLKIEALLHQLTGGKDDV